MLTSSAELMVNGEMDLNIFFGLVETRVKFDSVKDFMLDSCQHLVPYPEENLTENNVFQL